MDALRVSLLLIGVVIIAAIYLWDRRQRRRAEQDDIIDAALGDGEHAGDDDWDVIPLLRHAVRGVPVDDTHLREFAGINGREAKAAVTEDVVADSFAVPPASDGEPPPAEQLLVLSVITQEGEFFTGPTLSDLFERLGLQYGDMRIFHRLDAASGEPVFSVVSIIEPGYFDLETLHELRTPGLALFMRLPGPEDGRAAFEDMYATAQALAAAQEGRIGDQARNLLTDAALMQMRTLAARYRAIGS
ncbi:cell division protein ZipA C-terminal FtsZ-binding domain-containing protein [Sulfurivermis fontis]|uniref:cell division protein ZipA C-terminal FtsZ-binding domain-containing protein n=1 Tax=Sulfurivermis fontis TaxID=1972068 RepID=UPI000FD6FCAC|nr:cell division protein ZipA C-terminal FtsZ-binding domain-containing protein [Sulfurivermis fontis]